MNQVVNFCLISVEKFDFLRSQKSTDNSLLSLRPYILHLFFDISAYTECYQSDIDGEMVLKSVRVD